MTKLRPPMSIDGALSRIAGVLPGSWGEMAKLVERTETTVRKWGDHNQPEQISLSAAIALDIAFERAGGDGTPLLDTYLLQVQVSREEAFADGIAIQRDACDMAREAGQAVEALVRAGLPGATADDRKHAIAQIEDVDRVIPRAVARLRAKPPP